jgi:septation ring formation regulator EzrA
LTTSEPSSATTLSPGYPNTPEKQDLGIKSQHMNMMEEFKKEINNTLKEIQGNTIKQIMKLNKPVQDLKMEIETLKKTQNETTLEIENLGKRSGSQMQASPNRIQEIEEGISGIEDTLEDIYTTVKENTKSKKLLTQNIQEIQDTQKRLTLRTIGKRRVKIPNSKT